MDEEIILIEPMGHLVFSIAMVSCHMKNAEVTDIVATEFDNLLMKLIDRMSDKTTTDFGYVRKFSCNAKIALKILYSRTRTKW